MATCVPFQSQLASIMEALVRAAVAEISRLVDEKCACLHREISRRQSENDALRGKLRATESRAALLQQGFEKYVEGGVSVDDNRTVAARDVKFDLQSRSAAFTVKEESPDELWISDSAHTGSSVQFPSAALSDARRFDKNCQLLPSDGRSSQKNMDISLAFHPPHHDMGQSFIKTEKAETRSGFSQDSCQHGAGANNGHFALDERNSQLWSSIMDGNEIDSSFPDFSSVVDEYSDTFPEPADAAVKAGDVHRVQTHRNGAFDSDFSKDPAQMANFQAAVSSNSHSAHLQERGSDDDGAVGGQASVFGQSEYSPPQSFQSKTPSTPPQQQQQRGYACAQCGKTFGRLHQFKLHQQTHRRKRAFWCAVCGKSFMCSSHLRIHHRTHTGEKPFGCSVCGKRFTQQSSLRVHQRTHSGERPYSCSDCGKTFILMHHLKRHKIIHTYSG